MNCPDSLHWIHERTKLGIKPGAKRMGWILNHLNNPRLNIRGIHVDETSGRDSTAAYLRAILVENEYEVGTFISPSIETFDERTNLSGYPISNGEIVELVERVKPVNEALEQEAEFGPAVGFEVITTMVFLYFGEIHPADFVIVEAGLGVKNDSTNVFTPVLSILTSIGLDHVGILRSAYLDIAKDKGAIIEPSVLVIYVVKNEEALEYIRDSAINQNVKSIELDREIVIISEDGEFTYRYKDYELETIILDTMDDHQKESASLAVTALIELNEENIIELNFNKMIDAIESVCWTGRIKQIKEKPLIIIDGTYNNESVEALVSTIKNYYGPRKMGVLFSAIKSKPVNEALSKLQNLAGIFYFTKFDFHKALSRQELLEGIDTDNIEYIGDYIDLINHCDGEGSLITGSLYFVSGVKSKIEFNS